MVQCIMYRVKAFVGVFLPPASKIERIVESRSRGVMNTKINKMDMRTYIGLDHQSIISYV
jgi:hypothetical protein